MHKFILNDPPSSYLILNSWAHNPKAVGSNPAPATKKINGLDGNIQAFRFLGYRVGGIALTGPF